MSIEAPVEARASRVVPELLPAAENVAQDDLQSLDDSAPLPPLPPGLPNTPYRHCAALICAIVWQAIVERDMRWCAGPWFNFYLSLLGWDNARILAAKRRVLAEGFTFVRWTNGNWLNGLPMGVNEP